MHEARVEARMCLKPVGLDALRMDPHGALSAACGAGPRGLAARVETLCAALHVTWQAALTAPASPAQPRLMRRKDQIGCGCTERRKQVLHTGVVSPLLAGSSGLYA